MPGIVLGIYFIFYIIFPEYFAIEIHSTMPLLTASRAMILLLLTMVLIQNKGIIKIALEKYMIYFFIGVCFACFVHITTAFADVIKQLFRIVFEQCLVVILLYNAIDTEEKFERGLRFIIYSSTVISLLALIECVTGKNIFYLLTTVSRDALQASYERIGVRRAEGPFGHPVYLAVYNLLMLPFCFQFYEKTQKKHFLFIAVLNIISIFASISRGQIVILFVGLLIIYIDKRKVFRFEYVKKIMWVLPVMSVLFLIPEISIFLKETINSTLVALGVKKAVDLAADRNAFGVLSRLGQFSGIWWMAEHGKVLLGFGPNAQTRGLISYWNAASQQWNVVRSFDVGYLAHALQYGVIGFIIHLFYYFSIFKQIRHERNKKDVDDWNNSFYHFYILYFLCLFTTVGVDKVFWVITGLMNVYNRKTRRCI